MSQKKFTLRIGLFSLVLFLQFLYIGATQTVEAAEFTAAPGCVDDSYAEVVQALPATLIAGEAYTFVISVRNSGTTWWYHGGWDYGGFYQFRQKTGLTITPTYGRYSAATTNPPDAPPGYGGGQPSEISFTLTAPTTPGTHTLTMQTKHEPWINFDFELWDGTLCAALDPAGYPDGVWYGNEVTQTFNVIPPAPTGLSASCPSAGTSASLSWSLPSGYTLSYLRVLDNVTGGYAVLVPEWSGDSGPAFTFRSTPGRSYTWWAHSRHANGTPSNATFSSFTCAQQYTLSASTAGTGSGSVSGTGTYNEGTTGTLSASPSAGSTFAGWSGDCNSSGQVTMNGNKSCTATFTLGTYSLSVSTAGTGSGSVSGAGSYSYGATATAGASASSGSSFSGWSGDCNSSGQVTINGNKSCTATFTLQSYTLSATTAGTGSGSVSGTGSYSYGSARTLTATAAAGSSFAGWSGDCNSSGQVTMNGNKSCTATFTNLPPTLGNVTISSATVNPNNSTQYTITISGFDAAGTGDVLALHALINYQGGNAGSYRGYLMWNVGSSSYWSAAESATCGGGVAVIYASGYGPSYLHLDSCSVSNSGNTRTVSFVVRFDPSFTTPLTGNDISGLVYDTQWLYDGWVNFDTNFSLNATPGISSATISSATVNPNNSTQYTISVNGVSPVGAAYVSNNYALINYQGENAGNYRGYLTWYGPGDAWPGYQNNRACSGGGYAVVQPSYGNQYIQLDSCSIVDSGTMRTTNFVVRFNPSFTSPVTNNDISALSCNIVNGSQTCTSWQNFQTNFALGTSAASVPTITGVTSGYPNTSYTFSVNSTDPQGYQIRYGIDWDMDGTADEWLPAGVTYVNSGVSQSTSQSWSTTGSKTFRALSQNYQGQNSAWRTHTINIVGAPENAFCGTAHKTYPIGSTSYGSDTYCSTGTPSPSPAFPAAGSSSAWTCLGLNGGTDSPLCTATLPFTTHTLTTTPTTGGSVRTTDGYINCGNNCTYNYNQGSTVTLRAYPASSYWEFVRWTGDCAASSLPVCVLNINAPKTASAIFDVRLFNYQEF